MRNSTFDLPSVPNNGLPLHFRLGVIGASGSGKTTSVVSYINKHYKNKNIFNNIILISPTGCLNHFTGMRSECKWEGVADLEYENFSKMVIDKILTDQTERIVKHKEYLTDKKLWNKYIRDGVDAVNYLDIIKLYDKYNMEEPKAPYGTEHYPTLLLVFDDCCSATQDKRLSDVFSKLRHYNTSAIVLSQHYAQMSKSLRNNLSAMWLFKTADERLLKTLWEQQCSGDMKQERFLNMFKQLDNRWDFVFLRWDCPEDEKRYTKNFGEAFNNKIITE